eukprot:TRINITY_DN7789_c0_g1_i2.p1 TRINITY_DN7789_c0_g1~~TRINITY_DN7789_c0_g1_i2.p1  ORF type:complete len:851 (+),score=201.03 TRINITY_DN7789_c0_g1_i2:677-3229(+)
MVLCHEVGHLFGMRHCVYARCLMNGSNTLEEADGRPLAFCPVCLRKYADSVKGCAPLDPPGREKSLLSFFEAAGLDSDSRDCRARLRSLGVQVEGPAEVAAAAGPEVDLDEESEEGLPRCETSHGCAHVYDDPHPVPQEAVAAQGDPREMLRARLERVVDGGDSGARARLEEIEQMCTEQGKKWEDPDFPADASSVGLHGGEGESWDWVRVSEICPPGSDIVPDDCGPCDVRQGRFPDCFFITAAACVCERVADLKSLFVSPVLSENGVAAVRVWEADGWRTVVVDDRIPCEGNAKPLFARAPRGHAWPMLLEKAYAKFYGSYAAIEGGNIAEALHDLTGAPVETWGARKLPDGFWGQLRTLRRKGCAAAAGTPKTPDGQMHLKTKDGLVAGHAYGILDVHEVDVKGKKIVLLKLYNAWGKHSAWLGDWSRQSKLWSPALRKAVGEDGTPDGVFFMSATDFAARFETVFCAHTYVAKLTEPGVRYQGDFAARSGGATNFHTFRTNVSVVAVAESDAVVHCVVSQPDQRKGRGRGDDKPAIDYPQIGVCATTAKGEVAKCREPTPAALVAGCYDNVARTACWNRREVYCQVPLAKGVPVYITPSTFYPDEGGKHTVDLRWDKGGVRAEVADWDAMLKTSKVSGKWDYLPASAHSCHPQYTLKAPAGAQVTVILSQPVRRARTPPGRVRPGQAAAGRRQLGESDAATTTTTVGTHPIAIGLWKRSEGVADDADESRRIGGPHSFTNQTEVCRCFTAVEADQPYTLVCATMGKQKVADTFQLTALCSAGEVELVSVVPPAAAEGGGRSATRTRTPPRGRGGARGGGGGGGGGGRSMAAAHRTTAGLGAMYGDL